MRLLAARAVVAACSLAAVAFVACEIRSALDAACVVVAGVDAAARATIVSASASPRVVEVRTRAARFLRARSSVAICFAVS